MSNIEPTEEQLQKGEQMYASSDYKTSRDFAEILAEREAELRAELSEANAEINALRKSMMQADACIENFIANEDKADALLKRAGLDDTVNVVPRLAALVDEVVARRARVAELESEARIAWADCADGSCEACAKCVDQAKHQRDFATKRVAELEAEANDTRQELQMVLDDWNDMVRAIQAPAHGTAIARAKLLVQREAQHLADIKALRDRLYCHEDEVLCSVEEKSQPSCECTNCKLRRRTAHYDDAKADAPTVDWQAWANGTCPEPGCSLANPHEQGVACVKPTAAESPDCPRESPECITVGFHAVDECERRPSSFPAVCPKCQEGTHPFYDVEQSRWLCDRCHHPAGEPFVHDAEGGEG